VRVSTVLESANIGFATHEKIEPPIPHSTNYQCPPHDGLHYATRKKNLVAQQHPKHDTLLMKDWFLQSGVFYRI